MKKSIKYISVLISVVLLIIFTACIEDDTGESDVLEVWKISERTYKCENWEDDDSTCKSKYITENYPLIISDEENDEDTAHQQLYVTFGSGKIRFYIQTIIGDPDNSNTKKDPLYTTYVYDKKFDLPYTIEGNSFCVDGDDTLFNIIDDTMIWTNPADNNEEAVFIKETITGSIESYIDGSANEIDEEEYNDEDDEQSEEYINGYIVMATY